MMSKMATLSPSKILKRISMDFLDTKRKVDSGIYIDTNIMAFHVTERELDQIVEYLSSAIHTHCLMQFGESADEF